MAQIQQFIRSLARANPQQEEQLLQRVPLQKRAMVLMRAQQIRQQIRQQMQQQQQQQQQQGYNPAAGGRGMTGMQLSSGAIGLQQPGSHPAQQQQQQQQQARPVVVWSGIMELTEVVSFNL